MTTTITTQCVIPTTSYASRWEEGYATVLDMKCRVGDVVWWQYEPLKLRLGAKLFYTPDFVWLDRKGQLWCDEVKGFWRDDARVKIKSAAQQHPYLRFRAVQKEKGGWKYEDFMPASACRDHGE